MTARGTAAKPASRRARAPDRNRSSRQRGRCDGPHRRHRRLLVHRPASRHLSRCRSRGPAGYTDGLESIGTPTLSTTLGNDIFTTITFPLATNTTAIDYNFGEVTSSELSITKTGTPHTSLPGGQVVYTLEVTNAGPNAAVNAVMTDPLPGGTTFVSLVSPGGWSCTTPAVSANGTVSCSNASFAVGTQTFTLTVQLDAGLAPHSTIHNIATITSSSADIKPENNRDDEVTVVAATGDGDLGVTKTDNVDPVQVGQQVTYTITVTNHGPTATDATVTDNVPAGLNFVSATPSSGTCGVVNPVVCTIPGMARAPRRPSRSWPTR